MYRVTQHFAIACYYRGSLTLLSYFFFSSSSRLLSLPMNLKRRNLIDRTDPTRSFDPVAFGLGCVPVSPLWEPPAGTLFARRHSSGSPGSRMMNSEAGRGLLARRLGALRDRLSLLREAAAVRTPRIPLQQATLKSYINKNNFVFLYIALCILFCSFEYRSLPISDR